MQRKHHVNSDGLVQANVNLIYFLKTGKCWQRASGKVPLSPQTSDTRFSSAFRPAIDCHFTNRRQKCFSTQITLLLIYADTHSFLLLSRTSLPWVSLEVFIPPLPFRFQPIALCKNICLIIEIILVGNSWKSSLCYSYIWTLKIKNSIYLTYLTGLRSKESNRGVGKWGLCLNNSFLMKSNKMAAWPRYLTPIKNAWLSLLLWFKWFQ